MGRIIWREGGYRYVRCSSCVMVFADLASEDYARVAHNVWHEDAVSPDVCAFYGDARERAHHAFLQRHPPNGAGRLLDVGCGLGFFLERARNRGWDVVGCDPSNHWAREAEARLGQSSVVRGTASHPSLDGQLFDLITLWDVLEHVFDPVMLLARLRTLLAPGGALFVRTPNLAYVLPIYALRRELGHSVELGPTNHVVYFTCRTMRRALSDAALRPVDWRNLPPPQVPLGRDPSRVAAQRPDWSVNAKNAFARGAGALAHATAGRIVVSSDLDVVSKAD